MKIKKINFTTTNPNRLKNCIYFKSIFGVALLYSLMIFCSLPSSAHCDSYDGPTINDAIKALETNNVNLVLKWITKEQEKEIIPLFNLTYSLRTGDREVYEIVEEHFFETLVRLHRETEGAPYTGLKPAGTTKKIVQLSDKTIENNNIDEFLIIFNNHIGDVLREKFEKVTALNRVKNNSPEEGRKYVKAYVDYTHTIEVIHDIIEQNEEISVHNH